MSVGGHRAIVVDQLGKRYTIGAPRNTHPTLREWLAQASTRPLQNAAAVLRRESRSTRSTIWAFRHVSFVIETGEIVGIIGRNGSGKSTLLKVLARITRPTEGEARIYGRVGSLLEIGTGFHPELSGRENVFLSGSILGMRRSEIKRKFNEIVSFAEVEPFIDTAVKHYSTGMHVRLAFAVAAHLDPDVLLIDEVLAVGDASFQRKCLGKMDAVAKEGRTVLFVSHNMGLVQSLCSRAILMQNGRAVADDLANKVVAHYLQFLESDCKRDLAERVERPESDSGLRLTHVVVRCRNNLPEATLVAGTDARFEVHLTKLLPATSVYLTIYDQRGQPLITFDSAYHSAHDLLVADDLEAKFVCELDQLPLLPGRYRIDAGAYCDFKVYDHLEGAAFFDVLEGRLQGRSMPGDSGYGSILPPHRWTKPRV